MKTMFPRMTLTMAVLLLFMLLGGPQMTEAWAAAPQQEQPAQQDQNAQPLPDSPGASAQQQQQQQSKPAQDQNHAPLGAAAAQQSATAGGAASRPAGSAIAPAKQRQVRSFLIKLGVIAAAGGAIGAVYALTRGTSSTPPGSGR
jgi:predicted lipid-binding transport protein (Tim44 family)